MNTEPSFSQRLLAWFEVSGRHDLPWQQHKKECSDIYAVWLSEIMLQQTQVSTVIPYFQRFIKKFPTVMDLAAADWEDVATLWAGLGYYARAKNLHYGAKQVADVIHQTGDFPQTVTQWQAIKGVGQSTAGAIVAMGIRGFGVICDGNVKRVLSRWAMIQDDITKTATQKQLWQLAEQLTPEQNSGKYAQAMMDLGATICTRNQPKCVFCPVNQDCQAYQKSSPMNYPVKSKPKQKPNRYSFAIQLIDKTTQKTLWLKRKNQEKSGIWEGMWCLPIFDDTSAFEGKINWQTLQKQAKNQQIGENLLFNYCQNNQPIIQTQQTIKHTLTHFHWHLTLATIHLNECQYKAIERLLNQHKVDFCWKNIQDDFAKPKAMEKLLQ